MLFMVLIHLLIETNALRVLASEHGKLQAKSEKTSLWLNPKVLGLIIGGTLK